MQKQRSGPFICLLKLAETSSMPFLTLSQQERILQACSHKIHELLHLDKILPSLRAQKLLSSADQEILQSSNTFLSQREKIAMLISMLPRKDPQALQKFVACLNRTSYGTAHDNIASHINEQAGRSMAQLSSGGKTNFSKYRTCLTSFCINLGSRWITSLLFAIIFIALCSWYFHTIVYYIHKANANTLPYLSGDFVGREDELNSVVDLLGFGKTDQKIVNIYGSPGFGKSTLAIHVGHQVLEKGVMVHYVNLAKCPKEGLKHFIAETIMEGSREVYERANFNHFLLWVRNKFFYNLIILDNCDECLHDQKEELQSTIDSITESSDVFKILMTSREVTINTNSFEHFKLSELRTEAACGLLLHKLPKTINVQPSKIEELAELTGNVPLALQIIGSLFRLPGLIMPAKIIEELKKEPILTLSPEQLPKNKQINASFSLSYRYLSTKERRIGQFLSNFKGSFTLEASIVILANVSFPQKSKVEVEKFVSKSMITLVQRSLLEFDYQHDRYYFHHLIREYFLEKQQKAGLNDVHKYYQHFKLIFFRY